MKDQRRIDSTKLMFHPARVAQLRSALDWPTARFVYPVYIEVSPVGFCNHRCGFCGVDFVLEGNRKSKDMPSIDLEIIKHRFVEMSARGVRSVMFAGEGEPFLHKEIVPMAKAAFQGGLDVAFTTNGTLLDPDVLPYTQWIKVSVNAGTPWTYAKVHGTKTKDWDRVWDRISQTIVKRKASGLRTTIGVQCILLQENRSEFPALIAMCKNVGVDYLVIKPYSQHRFSINRFSPDYMMAMNYLPRMANEHSTSTFDVIVRTEAMVAVGEPIPYKKCHATPFLWAYIMANGDVYSCSAYLKDERFLLGNLNTQTFQEVWESDKRKANYELMQTLNIHECRRSCRMDASNRFIEEFETIEHRNFI